MPDNEELKKAYLEQYASANQTREMSDPEYWETAGESYRQDILQTIINHKLSGLIVDFGAGWGHLCKLLNNHGFNCKGVEISSDMSSYAQNKGLPVQNGSIELIERMENISSIVMCAVFEHLTDHDLWLKRFNRILPIGGTLVTLHPTAACFILVGTLVRFIKFNRKLPELHGAFCPPWHTAFFSLKGMEIIAGKNGFQIIDIQPASQGNAGGVTGFIQKMLGLVNWAGSRMMKLKWPLITTHIFVLKKINNID